MKLFYPKSVLLLLCLLFVNLTIAQQNQEILIAKNKSDLLQALKNKSKSQRLNISLSKNFELYVDIRVIKDQKSQTEYIGVLNNNPLNTFTVVDNGKSIEGEFFLKDQKKAYRIFEKNGTGIFAKEIDINKLLCVDFEVLNKNDDTGKSFSKLAPVLESLPGAPGVIYLDFDGELVTGTSWLGGATIDAQSPNFSDQKIIEVWKIMAEDFRPFNLNVTTNRSIYEATPSNRRMMCIFTTTKDAAPDSGGVAYINSFSSNRDNPCWVYNLGTRAAGETGSHEVGHTLGLGHDGKNSTTYYSGHADWSPIMGWSASKPIGHWSAGEYDGATNDQDDVAIIANNPGIGFQTDDHADNITDATPILVGGDGSVNASQNKGLISQRTDRDYFSFVIETGNVQFNITPDPDYPNLKIQAKVFNAINQEVLTATTQGMGAAINTQLTEGTYYLQIDGIGDGANPNVGYSDFSSLGNYFISGSYIPGDNQQPPVANFESNTDCGTVNFTSTSANTVTSYVWNFGDGNTSTEQNPTHTYTEDGNYTVTLTVSNDVGSDTMEKVDYVVINLPTQPIAENQNICAGESTTVTLTGSQGYRWYEVSQGGSSFTSGASYETPVLTATKTYYVEGFTNNCTTTTRTAVTVFVDEIPEPPGIVVNDGRNLTIEGTFVAYQWYLDGEIIEGATNQNWLPEAIGSYTVEVFNETGCNSISEIYDVDLSQLNASQRSEIFVFYPNPTKAELNIDGLSSKDLSIRIVNTYGQIVYEKEPTEVVEVQNLNRGMYMLLINNKMVGKFVKE